MKTPYVQCGHQHRSRLDGLWYQCVRPAGHRWRHLDRMGERWRATPGARLTY